MICCVWSSRESDEISDEANGKEGAFEGGVRGDGGLEANSVEEEGG